MERIPVDDKPLDPTVQRVAVGICLKGHTPPSSYHDRMMMSFNLGQREMEQRLRGDNPRYEFLWFSAGEIFVPYAREQLAEMALRYGCDWLFMVDDDMLVPPDLFYSLARHNVDICAALAFTRNPPHHPVIYSTIDGYDAAAAKPYFLTHTVKSYPRNRLVECDAVGFGSVLIKSSVLKAMPSQRFMSTNPSGEDVLFCNNAKKLGFRVYMDTSIKLGHLGANVVITEEYADEHNRLDEKERERLFGRYQKYPSMDLTNPVLETVS